MVSGWSQLVSLRFQRSFPNWSVWKKEKLIISLNLLKEGSALFILLFGENFSMEQI